MDYKAFIKEGVRGCYTIALHGITPEIVRQILDPSLNFIWVVRHSPEFPRGWWSPHFVPVTKSQAISGIEVRSLEYDAMLSFEQFKTHLPEFMEFRVNFYQLDRRVPDSLECHYVDNERRMHLLWKNNGIGAGLQWPGTGDVAVYWNRSREWLEKCVQIPEVQKILIR